MGDPLRIVAKVCNTKLGGIDMDIYPIDLGRYAFGDIGGAVGSPRSPEGPTQIGKEESGSQIYLNAPLCPEGYTQGGQLNPIVFLQPSTVTYPEMCNVGLSYEILGKENVSPYLLSGGAFYARFTAEFNKLCGVLEAAAVGEFCGVIFDYFEYDSGIPEEICIDAPDGTTEFVLIEKNENVRVRYSRVWQVLSKRYYYILSIDGEWKKVNKQACATEDEFILNDGLYNDYGSEGFPMVVPGEKVTLMVKTRNMGAERQPLTHTYFHTCALTGGRILAINDMGLDMPTTFLTYTVEVEGVAYVVRPSDYYQYNIGDWVYIMKPNSSVALDFDRTEGCTGEDFSAIPVAEQDPDFGYKIENNVVIDCMNDEDRPFFSNENNVYILEYDDDSILIGHSSKFNVIKYYISTGGMVSLSLSFSKIGGEWEEDAFAYWSDEDFYTSGRIAFIPERDCIGWEKVSTVPLPGGGLGSISNGYYIKITRNWGYGSRILESYFKIYTDSSKSKGIILPMHITGALP